jgi:transposase
MLKLYPLGYLNQTCSSPGSEAESRRNVDLMWLLGRLYLDHKSLTEFPRMHRMHLRQRVHRLFALHVAVAVTDVAEGVALLPIVENKVQLSH